MTTRHILLRNRSAALGLPEVVAVAGVAGALAAFALRSQGAGVYALCLAAAYLALLAWFAVHDIHTLKAPNRVVFPALALALVLSAPLGLHDFAEAALGGLGAFIILLLVAIVGHGAMGFGDVKVGAIAGFAVGLHGLVTLFVVTFAVGGLYAAVMLLSRLRSRRDVMAFTPLLAVGAAVCLAFTSGYLGR